MGLSGLSSSRTDNPELEDITTITEREEINQSQSKNGSSGSEDISGGEEGFMVRHLEILLEFIIILLYYILFRVALSACKYNNQIKHLIIKLKENIDSTRVENKHK